MKRIVILLAVAVLNTICSAYGQGTNPFLLRQLVPRAPNAAAFEKYLEVPVNLNAGQLGLAVPLYTIQSREIQVPIILTYNNSGLKLGDIPSWTGLGWDLNVGGVITQRTKGVPDDDLFGLLNSLYDVRNFDNYSDVQKVNLMRNMQKGRADLLNDIFSFNFSGKSGSFYINGTDECVPVVDGNLRISYMRQSIGGRINSFTITDDNGLQYLFGMREESHSQ